MSVLTDQMRAAIREELAKYPDKQAATLPALHITQDALRHVPLEAIREIAEMLDLHPAQVHDTMSFYGFSATRNSRWAGIASGFAAVCRVCCAAARSC